MPLTPEQVIEELKARILALEEEKDRVTKRFDGHPLKEEVRVELEGIKRELAEARKELTAMIKSPKLVTAKNDQREEEDWDEWSETRGSEGADHGGN